ncbi:MAG TPA: FAD-binding protein [Candidatus Hydrogenedentes bacterium]|nr:FAD-binding protein [Candidatus Hydrogenedentota bacterium]HPG69303.1 FAD-binding protein [Candidatus Hydrogenedentota bacterium]
MINRKDVAFGDLIVPVYSLNTVIVGTGAAGLNCAVRLFREMEETGVADPHNQVALLTRGIGLGTSNNSGSDKQTYYKLGTHGQEPDTPVDFAKTLIGGGCMHGDVALVEGENSLRGFYHLVDIGVPFPHNARGGFVGYKTDHDPRQRATSAGPWTSRYMVQKLLIELNRFGVSIFNRYHVLAIVRDDEASCGLLALDLAEGDDARLGLTLFNCHNVVMATGGPGELYAISVYPKGQMGSYAALLDAGVTAHNLTESQFGLASLEPRWNLSGTYQQVIPRYFSTDEDGHDPQDFLNPWFASMQAMATNTFLKGYQWPFDHDKVAGYGSSLIDIIVQNETVNKGRRVYMDLRENPRAVGGLDAFSLADLRAEARAYLEQSGATQCRPIERLAHMNQPSIDLYADMGVDLWKDPLPVGVCAQHCNGGFVVDAWWESSLKRLFVVGELAGTHGVKRPGGSALNAGQVGGLRAAQRIAHVYYEQGLSTEEFSRLASAAVERFATEIRRIRAPHGDALDGDEVKRSIQRRMSAFGGMVRSLPRVREALAAARTEWRAIAEHGLRSQRSGVLKAIEVRELALTQRAFLEAIQGVLERGGGSRGSYLVMDPHGTTPHPRLGDDWKYMAEEAALRHEILCINYDVASDRFSLNVTEPRDLPVAAFWFENTWAEYRRGTVFRRTPDEPVRPYGVRHR